MRFKMVKYIVLFLAFMCAGFASFLQAAQFLIVLPAL
jgi:hypothetical protein